MIIIQLGEYYKLQTSDRSSAVLYEKMKTELQLYQEVNESSVLSSTSSESCYSNTSYPVQNKNERRIYVNNLNPSPAKSTTSFENNYVTLTDGSSKKGKSESSEYLDPILMHTFMKTHRKVVISVPITIRI